MSREVVDVVVDDLCFVLDYIGKMSAFFQERRKRKMPLDEEHAYQAHLKKCVSTSSYPPLRVPNL